MENQDRGKKMYCKLVKIIEVALRVTKCGKLISKIAEQFIGKKKAYVNGARSKIEQMHHKIEADCVVKERTWERQCDLQIIIPMHNATKYIKQCIESILLQKTKYKYQIILVDDGSTDDTYENAKKYLSDERVQLITQKNAGAAAARNTGLKHIVADFIMFVDIDDALKPDAIEVLLDKAYQEEAQIVEGGYEIFDTKVLAKECHENAVLEEPCGVLWGFPWGKIISASLFRNISFPEGYWYEDTIMSYLIYPRSKKTVTIDKVVYSYRKNPSGFSHISGNNSKILDTYWVMEIMLQDMKKLDITPCQSIYEQYLKSILTGCKRMMYMKKDIRKATLSMYSEMLCSDWKDYTTRDKRMKGFEKAVRNNQYHVWKVMVLCL